MNSYSLELTVNGNHYSVQTHSHVTLLAMLRDQLELTGVKECCAMGECGACTVLVNGLSVNSCLMLAAEADGSEVCTVEGLAPAGALDALQNAFLDHGAVQCGFCIPGMLMSARALLDRAPHPSEGEIRDGLSGNLCRCGGYTKIIEAVAAAAELQAP